MYHVQGWSVIVLNGFFTGIDLRPQLRTYKRNRRQHTDNRRQTGYQPESRREPVPFFRLWTAEQTRVYHVTSLKGRTCALPYKKTRKDYPKCGGLIAAM